MRYAAQAVKLDVVLGSELIQHALGLAAQISHLDKGFSKLVNSSRGGQQQLAYQRISLAVHLRVAALADFIQPVVQGVHQLLAAFGVVQQVILQIGVALHYPDIAQYLVQHAGRTAGTALLAQRI